MNDNDMRFGRPNFAENNSEQKPKFFHKLKSGFKKLLKGLGIVVIILVLIGLAIYGKDIYNKTFAVKAENYSAVFLSNDQVYFGKIEINNEKEIVLTNVFYIQVNPVNAEGQTTNLNQSGFNLVKLGQELHGPTDELFVNRQQVVFYENLRDDSKVVESIKNYKIK